MKNSDVLKYEEGSVGAFATTFANFYIEALNSGANSNDAALRHVIFIYRIGRDAMGRSEVDVEQLLKDSRGCLARLIFCILCEDEDILDAFSNGTDIADEGIGIVFDCVNEVAPKGVISNKTTFQYWVQDYFEEKLLKQSHVNVSAFMPPKQNPVPTDKNKALKELFDLAASHSQIFKLKNVIAEQIQCYFELIDDPEEEAALSYNFNKRFQLSYSTLIIALINYSLGDSSTFPRTTLRQFNSQCFNGALELRNEIKMTTPAGYFAFDKETRYEATNSVLFEKYCDVLKAAILDIGNLPEGKPVYNIYSLFDKKLGLLLPPIEKDFTDVDIDIEMGVYETVKILTDFIATAISRVHWK